MTTKQWNGSLRSDYETATDEQAINSNRDSETEKNSNYFITKIPKTETESGCGSNSNNFNYENTSVSHKYLKLDSQKSGISEKTLNSGAAT